MLLACIDDVPPTRPSSQVKEHLRPRTHHQTLHFAGGFRFNCRCWLRGRKSNRSSPHVSHHWMNVSTSGHPTACQRDLWFVQNGEFPSAHSSQYDSVQSLTLWSRTTAVAIHAARSGRPARSQNPWWLIHNPRRAAPNRQSGTWQAVRDCRPTVRGSVVAAYSSTS